MDESLLRDARDVALRLNRRVQLTLPSILAEGEEFALRVTVFAPEGLPSGEPAEEIAFEPSPGVEGLPPTVRVGQESNGTLEVGGLTAVGPEGAQVRARVRDTAVASNPAWVFAEPPYRVYWGDLHVHTEYSNCSAWSCKDPAFCYAFARDAAHLDFAAAADHLRGIASDESRWPRLQALVREYDRPGRFVPFLAFESSHKAGFGGDNNAYYRGADGPFFWLDRDDMRGTAPAVPLEELWRFLDASGEAYFTVPHHTGRAGKYRSFQAPTYDGRREPLFEIYSAWGSSERRRSRFPLHAGNTDEPAYFVDALTAGCRYGVIASSDDHTTLPGGESRNWGAALGLQALSGYHHMGLAAVRAASCSRAELWDALTSRRTYATTFARTLLDVRLGDVTMGQAAQLGPADPLRRKRSVRVRLSTADRSAASVTLVRNGDDLARQSVDRDATVAEIAFEDGDDLDAVAVRGARFHPEPFAAYYVRVETDRNETQWSSPIWLDL